MSGIVSRHEKYYAIVGSEPIPKEPSLYSDGELLKEYTRWVREVFPGNFELSVIRIEELGNEILKRMTRVRIIQTPSIVEECKRMEVKEDGRDSK